MAYSEEIRRLIGYGIQHPEWASQLEAALGHGDKGEADRRSASHLVSKAVVGVPSDELMSALEDPEMAQSVRSAIGSLSDSIGVQLIS